MGTPTFNVLSARKELGAIRHRLADDKLDPGLRVRIVDRHIDNLLETLPAQFHELLLACRAANILSDLEELGEGMVLLADLLPGYTLGSLTAGSRFKLIGGATIYTKRKSHLELICGATIDPFPPETEVLPCR